jgi:hypothetical protein
LIHVQLTTRIDHDLASLGSQRQTLDGRKTGQSRHRPCPLAFLDDPNLLPVQHLSQALEWRLPSVDVVTNLAWASPIVAVLTVRRAWDLFAGLIRQYDDGAQFALVGIIRQCTNIMIIVSIKTIYTVMNKFCALFRFVNQASFTS